MAKKRAVQEDVTTTAAGIVKELLSVAKKERGPRELAVGIRNVSSETIWIPKQVGEEPLLLHPTVAGEDDPNAVAIISLARWQLLRRDKLVGRGMLVRDDAILGEADVRAPDDQPGEVHPEHEKNVVPDPHVWIQSRDETQLRTDIALMTSESSLRRLWAAVDAKIGELERHVSKEERRAKYSAGIRKAIMSLPMKYRLTEELVQERLDELVPWDRDIPDKFRF